VKTLTVLDVVAHVLEILEDSAARVELDTCGQGRCSIFNVRLHLNYFPSFLSLSSSLEILEDSAARVELDACGQGRCLRFKCPFVFSVFSLFLLLLLLLILFL
jgi:hypothetical protein